MEAEPCARDSRLGREVAVKIVSEPLGADGEALERFEREARLSGSLSDPNVVALYDVGSHQGMPFFVTELLRGDAAGATRGGTPVARCDAGHRRADCGGAGRGTRAGDRPPGPETGERFPHPGRSRKAARLRHRQGDGGRARAFRARAAGEDRPALARWDPERARCSAHLVTCPRSRSGERVDPRTDFFSFGAVLFEMLTSRRAFPGFPPSARRPPSRTPFPSSHPTFPTPWPRWCTAVWRRIGTPLPVGARPGLPPRRPPLGPEGAGAGTATHDSRPALGRACAARRRRSHGALRRRAPSARDDRGRRAPRAADDVHPWAGVHRSVRTGREASALQRLAGGGVRSRLLDHARSPGLSSPATGKRRAPGRLPQGRPRDLPASGLAQIHRRRTGRWTSPRSEALRASCWMGELRGLVSGWGEPGGRPPGRSPAASSNFRLARSSIGPAAGDTSYLRVSPRGDQVALIHHPSLYDYPVWLRRSTPLATTACWRAAPQTSRASPGRPGATRS